VSSLLSKFIYIYRIFLLLIWFQIIFCKLIYCFNAFNYHWVVLFPLTLINLSFFKRQAIVFPTYFESEIFSHHEVHYLLMTCSKDFNLLIKCCYDRSYQVQWIPNLKCPILRSLDASHSTQIIAESFRLHDHRRVGNKSFHHLSLRNSSFFHFYSWNTQNSSLSSLHLLMAQYLYDLQRLILSLSQLRMQSNHV